MERSRRGGGSVAVVVFSVLTFCWLGFLRIPVLVRRGLWMLKDESIPLGLFASGPGGECAGGECCTVAIVVFG
jgi:hypothetical protein